MNRDIVLTNRGKKVTIDTRGNSQGSAQQENPAEVAQPLPILALCNLYVNLNHRFGWVTFSQATLL